MIKAEHIINEENNEDYYKIKTYGMMEGLNNDEVEVVVNETNYALVDLETQKTDLQEQITLTQEKIDAINDLPEETIEIKK